MVQKLPRQFSPLALTAWFGERQRVPRSASTWLSGVSSWRVSQRLRRLDSAGPDERPRPPLGLIEHIRVEKLPPHTVLRLLPMKPPGTPALVWKDRDGKVRFKVGVLRLSELAQNTRLPRQPIEDPEQAKFR